jgi:cytochrome c556
MRLKNKEFGEPFMRRNRHWAIFITGSAMVAGIFFLSSDLRAQSDLEEIVEERQELMKTMSQSFPPIVAVVRDESDDLQAAAAAAERMNDAISRAAEMFPPGTSHEEITESRAKPEVWTKSTEFVAAAERLEAETAELASLAHAGDVDAFKTQFQEVAQACGGCHEARGSEGGEFRIPRAE